MPGRDLRDFIDDLEERNELRRIKAEVDWNEELGAITISAGVAKRLWISGFAVVGRR